jgi:hypothetical protein
MSDDYQVRIRDELTEDDGLALDLGPLGPGEAWWEKPLPPCPDCGGALVWFEAGYVPGTRKCLGAAIGTTPDGRATYDPDGGCGSMFAVRTPEGGPVTLRRERFY